MGPAVCGALTPCDVRSQQVEKQADGGQNVLQMSEGNELQDALDEQSALAALAAEGLRHHAAQCPECRALRHIRWMATWADRSTARVLATTGS